MLLAFQTSLQAGTTPTQENVTKLYVATFNRAPDAGGLDYWVNGAGLDLGGIAKSFFDQPETQQTYPPSATTTEFVEAIYHNLFNRASEQAGLNYWVAELDSGRIARSVFIQAVINGAQDTEEFGNDATILANKTTIGLAFADAGLDDTEEAKKIMLTITDKYNSVTATAENYNLEVPIRDQIIIENLNDPAGYGYDAFFKVYYSERKELEYEEASYIIMTDGNTEKTVGKHTSGTGTYGLVCTIIGGYGDYSEWSTTDNRISYNCKYGNKDINIFLEKGKQYSFFLRYFKEGQVTEESAIQATIEYGDKMINIDNLNGSLPIDSLNGKTLREDEHWQTEIKIDALVVNQKSASIDFRAYNCGGDLIYSYQKNEGYFFQEMLTYGDCNQGCKLWIKGDGSEYKEYCDDNEFTGMGNLSEI